MAGLAIPESSLEALGALIRASDEAMAELLAAAADLPISLDVDATQAHVSPQIKSAKPEEVEKLVRVLLTLNATRGHFDVEVTEFVNDVLDAMAQSGQETLRLSEDEKTKVRERLIKILSFPKLGTAAKAMHLRDDHERIFYNARILTDARPVYGTDPSAPPSAILISHTLKLSFSKDDGYGDFFIVLDRDDIEYLKELIERAEAKETSLRHIFESAKIPVVDS